jgi:hypothetical protein
MGTARLLRKSRRKWMGGLRPGVRSTSGQKLKKGKCVKKKRRNKK